MLYKSAFYNLQKIALSDQPSTSFVQNTALPLGAIMAIRGDTNVDEALKAYARHMIAMNAARSIRQRFRNLRQRYFNNTQNTDNNGNALTQFVSAHPYLMTALGVAGLGGLGYGAYRLLR